MDDGRKMAGASLDSQHSSHKRLLQNYIRHAGAHNKIKEESEMWSTRQRELSSDQTDYKLKSREERKYSVRSHRYAAPSRPESHGNVYQKELMKMKDADPMRWGHSGYKELYPEDFASSESCGSEEEEEEEDEERSRRRERRKARKRSAQDSEVPSAKKGKKEAKKRKSKKAKKDRELQEKKDKRKKHLKQKRHKRGTGSPSTSLSSASDKW